ncbi:MAG: ABC transporter ATP-binding protein [Thermodesulfobacteriota bacterium]
MLHNLLSVKNLRTAFHTTEGTAVAVDGVSLDLARGETVAVVGESGCGKTVLGLSILGLVQPPGRIDSGEVVFDGRDLRGLSAREMRAVRGNRISMIFQEPMTSLNPVLRVGEQIAEAIRLHRGKSRRQALEMAREMLSLVGIADAGRRLSSYPHELSGGMRQRVMIAIALCLSPDLLLADEPTTALDVTIQKQILDLMLDLAAAKGTAIALITHNLGVVAETCDNAAVMYSGQVVEYADVPSLFEHPLHPYTAGLIRSLPKPGVRKRLEPIPGTVPSLTRLPAGCRFHPRCPKVFDRCRTEVPPYFRMSSGRGARCWLWAETAAGSEA